MSRTFPCRSQDWECSVCLLSFSNINSKVTISGSLRDVVQSITGNARASWASYGNGHVFPSFWRFHQYIIRICQPGYIGWAVNQLTVQDYKPDRNAHMTGTSQYPVYELQASQSDTLMALASRETSQQVTIPIDKVTPTTTNKMSPCGHTEGKKKQLLYVEASPPLRFAAPSHGLETTKHVLIGSTLPYPLRERGQPFSIVHFIISSCLPQRA